MKSVRKSQRIVTVVVFLLLGVAGLLQAQTSSTNYRRHYVCDHRT
jgi:hypothetical protein